MFVVCSLIFETRKFWNETLNAPCHFQRGRLVKVVELIQGIGIEAAVRKAAWSQLAFLLEDPHLHKPFLQLFSLQYLVTNFVGMMKVRLVYRISNFT